MVETGRRRRRPAVSCTLCRRRKIRCNREVPCSNCIRSKAEACVYENEPTAQSQHRGSIVDHDAASSTSAVSTTPASEVDSLRSQIQQLEQQLEQQLQRATSQPRSSCPAPSPAATIEASSTRIGGTFYIHRGNPVRGQHPGVNRSVTHKKRMFGQSHWMNYGIVLIRDIAEMIDEHARQSGDGDDEQGEPKLFEGMYRCKRLARVTKAQRTPSWPCPPTPELPPKRLADELVECYLRTSESVYRVLHVPSFRRDYNALWVTGAEPDRSFPVQLKLVLAIGATTYDRYFSLRPSAIRWVYEAESWFAHPSLKHRLGLQYLQIHALVLIGRELAAVGEDLVWISAGSLLRSAIYMGLHRDPDSLPPRTAFANEVHRRLWSTILELCLQSSLNSGGPPLISMEDFDTLPPCNFDDEQLTIPDAMPKPDNEFTQVSVAVALCKMLPVRLAVCRFLNDFSSRGTYAETLRLDAEFKSSHKSLRSAFQAFYSGLRSPSEYEVRIVEIIVHRYLAALHMPFFSSGLKDSAHAYSRKVAVESSLKSWYAANLSSNVKTAPLPDPTAAIERAGVARVMTCGSGFFRIAITHALLVIGVELREQISEDDSLGPVLPRRDLLAVLEDAKAWSFWCIEAGETNTKGHVLVCLLLAQIEGLREILPKNEIAALVADAAKEAVERSLAIMESMVDQGSAEQTVNGLDQMSLDRAAEVFEGWDLMMKDIPFDPNNLDPMSWMLDSDMQTSFLW
ncbi:hypothetical protein K458DRAFT_391743 [Lentithecium fluviatile CBS 122367]|uniref:Zn(2)-C6 fungal-type domain-containing protein n=1 Tax=Lentithecium fluviatile CBS 122367 TaxID=1168545 RepID=A0A6G1IV05_9PLEO|nr:hypothetical protein K458DRAFT_391743 [Lentithecium fluviatile CBS 122367]